MTDNACHLAPDTLLAELRRRLAEPAPGRLQLVAGPRQVGKTTVLLSLADHEPGARYVAADSPETSLAGHWDRVLADTETSARTRGRAWLLIDEIHAWEGWSVRLKAALDRWRRQKLPIHVVATGSSALHLATGARESLAGRFERLTLAHWSAGALARAFSLDPDSAALLAVSAGTYPGAMPLRNDPARWKAYVRDAIVEPALGRDLLALTQVRKPALLRQLFAVAAGNPAQVVSLQKLQGQLQDPGALETIASYLALLEDAYLVAALQKHSDQVVRRRAAPPKLVVLNNALLAVTDPLGAPTKSTDPRRFGLWVENACLAHAINSGQQVRYWREEPLEVDGVLDGSWGKWAIEVKTGDFTLRELRGLFTFCGRFPGYRPLVVCGDEAGVELAKQAGAAATTWPRFLVEGAGA